MVKVRPLKNDKEKKFITKSNETIINVKSNVY